VFKYTIYCYCACVACEPAHENRCGPLP